METVIQNTITNHKIMLDQHSGTLFLRPILLPSCSELTQNKNTIII
mgnify:CR=1 FL=1